MDHLVKLKIFSFSLLPTCPFSRRLRAEGQEDAGTWGGRSLVRGWTINPHQRVAVFLLYMNIYHFNTGCFYRIDVPAFIRLFEFCFYHEHFLDASWIY